MEPHMSMYYWRTVILRLVVIDRDPSLYVAETGCSRRESARFRRPSRAESARGWDFLPEFERHAFGKAPEARGLADFPPQIGGNRRDQSGFA